MDTVLETHVNGVIALLEGQKEKNLNRMRIVASASPSEYDQLDTIDGMYDLLISSAKLYMEEI